MRLSNEIRVQLRSDIDNNPVERMIGQRRPWHGIEQVAAHIQVPTLVIAGASDDVVPTEEPIQYFLQLQEPIRHLHVFSGIGHYPNAQIPKRLVKIIKTFIDNPA